MSTFSTPIPAGTALQRVTPSAPAPGMRFSGDRLMWIGVPAGTAIAAFATGCIAVASGAANGLPGNPGGAWTLFQLSPLPAMDRVAFNAVPGGLPVQLVLVTGSGGPGPVADDVLGSGAALVAAPSGSGSTAFVAFAFQDRLCRDPLGAAEAIAASGACDANWPAFIAALAALPGARHLRALDHHGVPLTGVTVAVAVDGAPAVSVALTPAMDGDTGVAVPAASVATVTTPGTANSLIGGGEIDVGAFQTGLVLPAGRRLVQVTNAADWLAVPDPGVTMQQWNANSFVETIQDGTGYFKRLVTDLRGAKPNGAVQFAGWVFTKGSLEDSSVDWLLDSSDKTTALVPLLTELRDAGVTPRMLINRFLQFDSPTLDDFPELAPILLTTYGALGPLDVLLKMQTDPAGYVVGFIAVVALSGLVTSSVTVDLIKKLVEQSQPLKDALDAVDPAIATWTPYPAAFADNPIVTAPPKILGHTIDDISHIGVYHQKYVMIRTPANEYVAYLGGIDINSDRLDTPLHRAKHPFHDLQVRITGPAVRDVLLTYQDRAAVHGGGVAIPPPATVPPTSGKAHLVQIARNYFKPAAGNSPLTTAPHGESTPVRTIKAAIAQARDFITIEDQYFSPPDDYVQTLIDAAAPARGVRGLMITMPFATDQPYGSVRREQILAALSSAWGARFYAGTPLRRFLHETPKLTTNLGRMHLVAALPKASSIATIAPLIRMPPPPFWAFIGNELVLVHAISSAASGENQGVELSRAPVGTGWGAQPVDHPIGAPVMAVQVPSIYVHAKMMIVDDIFLFAGSSNLNRRGFYHDGEMDSFTIPQHLRGDPTNPARILRSRLMAEHMGLSTEMGESLFADPAVGLAMLTSRSWYEGGRWQKLNFFASLPPDVPIGTAGSAAGFLLKVLIGALQDAAKPDVWPLLADPTAGLDPNPGAKGPDFP